MENEATKEKKKKMSAKNIEANPNTRRKMLESRPKDRKYACQKVQSNLK